MSQPIMSSSLSNPVAGATGYMDWSGNGLPVTGGQPAQILLQNESGCGLRVKLRGSGRGFDFPAGAWMQGPMPLQPNETGLDYTILYVLPNQPVGLLLGTYYAPGEIAVGVSLGNSPIGLSGSVSTTNTTVINDGNAADTVFVEGTATGSSGSNVSIDNSGNMFLAEEVLGPTYQKIFQAVAGAAVGADAVILGANKANFTHVQNELKVDRASSLDAGNITTDGAGSIAVAGNVTFGTAVSGVQSFLTYDAVNHQVVHWTPQAGVANGQLFIVWTGTAQLDLFSVGGQFGGALTWIDNTGAFHYGAGHSGSVSFITFDDVNHENTYWTPQSGVANGHTFVGWNGSNLTVPFSVCGQFGGAPAWIGNSGNVGALGGVSTAGPYGVPLNTSNGKDINVVNTTLTTIATFTTPNDGANHDVLALGQLYVGAANTNNGVVTLQIAYTDPHQGALTLQFNVYGQTNLINGIAQAKGVGIQTDPRHIRCSPNTAVTISYKNTAAGTISDFASGSLLLVN